MLKDGLPVAAIPYIDSLTALDIKNPHKTEDLHEYTSQEIIGLLEQSFAKSNELLGNLRNEVLS
jgi:type I restriction enzyme M protein